MNDVTNQRDEWRVEVEIADEPGLSLAESLGAARLDDEAREALGGQVIVTRDGNLVFAYTRNESSARAAEAEIRKLVSEDGLEASISLTRWHPLEEDWKDVATPMPSTPGEESAERARHEAAEKVEEEESGESDWEVAVHLETIGDMVELDRKLRDEGFDVSRRWKYLMVGAPTEPRATELADRIRALAPASAEVEVLVNPDDLPNPTFVAIGALASRLRDRI